MFGTKEAPALPYRRSQIADLAKQVVRAQTTLPGVQAKLSLDINPGGKNEPYKFTIVGLWGRYILKPQTDTCPTSASPLAYGLSTRSHFASETSKPCLPALCFTQNSAPTFSPKIFTLRPHHQDDHVECNGVGDEWPCAILRNPKWHETACSRRQAPISPSYPRKPDPPPLNRPRPVSFARYMSPNPS